MEIKEMYEMEYDWWYELPIETQKEIDISITEIDNGNVISHEAVKKMYPQWFIK